MSVDAKTWAAVALGALDDIWENLDRKAAKGSRLTLTQEDQDGLGLAMTALRKITEETPPRLRDLHGPEHWRG
jgi:hypothetical protein